MPAMVERVVYVGSVTQVYLRLTTGASLQALVANHDGPPDWPEGTPVSSRCRSTACAPSPSDPPSGHHRQSAPLVDAEFQQYVRERSGGLRTMRA